MSPRARRFFGCILPLAFLVPGLVGLIVGLPTLRGVGGDYLGIVTLGFGEIVRILLINLEGITRGPMGIPGIPPRASGGSDRGGGGCEAADRLFRDPGKPGL